MGKLTIQDPNGGPPVTVDVDKQPTHEDVDYIASQVFGKRQLTAGASAQPYISKRGEDPFNAGDPTGHVATFEKQGGGLGVRSPVILSDGQAGTRVRTRSGAVQVFGPDGSLARPDGSPWTVAGQETPQEVEGRVAATDATTHAVFPSVPKSYWGGAFKEAIQDNPVKVGAGYIASGAKALYESGLRAKDYTNAPYNEDLSYSPPTKAMTEQDQVASNAMGNLAAGATMLPFSVLDAATAGVLGTGIKLKNGKVIGPQCPRGRAGIRGLWAGERQRGGTGAGRPTRETATG
jgi:hypothetical protein